MLDIVEKLDILLYNPVFENFVKDRFGNKMNYKRECSNIKKIAIAYSFLNKLLFRVNKMEVDCNILYILSCV